MKEIKLKTLFGEKKLSILITFVFFFFTTGIRAQVTAGFDVNTSEGCSPLQVNFTSTSSSGSGDPLEYIWQFGYNDAGATTQNAIYTYNYGNETPYTAKLIAINSNDPDNDRDTFEIQISVTQTPSAKLNVSTDEACINELVRFDLPGGLKDSVRLDFGDGTFSQQLISPITHRYKDKNNDQLTIKYNTYYKGCTDTDESKVINIRGPIVEYYVSEDSACVDDEITFGITSTTPGIDSMMWVFGNGTKLYEDTVTYSFSAWGNHMPALKVYDDLSANCNIEVPIHVYHVKADITYEDSVLCAGRYISFQNPSSGNDYNRWDFGDGRTSTEVNPADTFSVGQQTISLEVENEAGCTDRKIDTLTIYEVPDIDLGEDWYVCAGESVQLSASGGDSIFWVPSTNLDDPGSYTPTVTDPEQTISYQANVVNTSTGCKNTGYITVDVVPIPVWNVEFDLTKDTVIIGDLDTIFVDLNGNYEYIWTSDDSIVYHSSDTLVVRPQITKDDYAYYNIRVFDSRNCFDYTDEVQIYVREEYSFGIPEAFSPNNDGINDFVKVNGWGIKDLIEFRVFNRWGTEIFYTDDVNTSWDGTVDGTPQPIDSYGYLIRIEHWNGEIEEQRGTFSLVR